MIYLFDSGVATNSNYCKQYLSLGSNLKDQVGHGTTMASVIKQISPQSEIISIKLGDQNPSLQDIHQCLKFVDKDGIILFNANFEFQYDVIDFENSLKILSKKHKIIVPAGNNARSIDHYSPARCDFVWTIGSLNKSRQPTKVTNTSGQKNIDFWAVSTNIKALDISGQEVRIFGTSVAAAIAAALSDKYHCKNKFELQLYIDEYNEAMSIN